MKARYFVLPALFAVASISISTVSANGILVDSKEYPDWPFPDAQGILECDSPGPNIILRTSTGAFALNGKALSKIGKRPYLDTRAYQKRDEYGMFSNGVKTISSLIEIGLPLCEEYK